MKGEPSADGLHNIDAVIHLAGAPVAQRWTEQAKRDIRESRVVGHAQSGQGDWRSSPASRNS